MRTLVVTENITLDGVIDATEGWFAPAGEADIDQTDLNECHCRQPVGQPPTPCCSATGDVRRDARLLGRCRPFDETGVAEYLNSVDKHVVSSTMTDPQWQRSTVLAGDFDDQVRELKSREGRDIVVSGSIALVHELIALGLVR